jgi:hypothetical protein
MALASPRPTGFTTQRSSCLSPSPAFRPTASATAKSTRANTTWLSWTNALNTVTSGRLSVRRRVQEDQPWPCRAYINNYFLVGSALGTEGAGARPLPQRASALRMASRSGAKRMASVSGLTPALSAVLSRILGFWGTSAWSFADG